MGQNRGAIMSGKIDWSVILQFCPFDLSDMKSKTQVEIYNEAPGEIPGDTTNYNCTMCNNKGHISIAYDGIVHTTKPCECMQIRANIRRTKESGLETEYLSKTFDNYIANTPWQKYIKEQAITFCREGGDRWFFIGGQSGSGKSHICYAICSEFQKKGKEVKSMEWVTEAKKLKALSNDVQYSEITRMYKHYDVLYIDDFMKVKQGETPTGADVCLAFDILNSRLRDRTKITIISSEFAIENLMSVDEGVASRINERAKPYVLCITQDKSKNYRMTHNE